MTALRVQTAKDVVAIIEEQLNAVRGEPCVGVLEKARTIGYLATVALRAVEAADVETRLEALERTIGGVP